MSEENSDTLREAVAAAFADIPDDGGWSSEDSEVEAVSLSEDSESDEPQQSAESKSDDKPTPSKARDGKGRFSKNEQKTSESLEGSDQKDIGQSEGLETSEATETSGPILAPNSWSTEEKAKFASLPSDLKEIVNRREKERDSFIFQKSEELSRAQRRYAEIDEIIGPREQQLRLAGLTPAAYLHQVIAGAEMLDANPIGTIKHFINHYGINPQQLFSEQSQQVDPYRARLDRIEYELQARTQQAQEAQRAQILGGIEQQIHQYRNETDANGAPVRPYFDSVSAHINQLVPLIRAENPALSVREVLDRAYDQAVYANPQARTEILKRERAAQEAKNIEEAKKRASSARARGSSISGAPGGNSVKSPSGLRSIVESAFNEYVR